MPARDRGEREKLELDLRLKQEKSLQSVRLAEIALAQARKSGDAEAAAIALQQLGAARENAAIQATIADNSRKALALKQGAAKAELEMSVAVKEAAAKQKEIEVSLNRQKELLQSSLTLADARAQSGAKYLDVLSSAYEGNTSAKAIFEELKARRNAQAMPARDRGEREKLELDLRLKQEKSLQSVRLAEIALAQARKSGDAEATAIAFQQLGAARENAAIQGTIADNSRKALALKQSVAKLEAEMAVAVKQIRMENAIFLSQLAREEKLLKSIRELEKAREASAIAIGESGSKRLNAIAGGLDATKPAILQARAQMEEMMASRRLQSLQREQEMERRSLALEQQKVEAKARQDVLLAREVVLRAKGAQESAIAREQLVIAEKELGLQLRIAGASRQALALKQQTAIAQKQSEEAARRFNAELEQTKAIAASAKTDLEKVAKFLGAEGELRSARLETGLSSVGRAGEIFNRLKNDKLNYRTRKELEGQLGELGYKPGFLGIQGLDKAIAKDKAKFENDAAKEKQDKLLLEQALEKSLLDLDLRRLEISGRQSLQEAKILELQSRQQQVRAREMGDAEGAAMAAAVADMARKQAAIAEQDIAKQLGYGDISRRALGAKQEAARVRFASEENLRRMRQAEELAKLGLDSRRSQFNFPESPRNSTSKLFDYLNSSSSGELESIQRISSATNQMLESLNKKESEFSSAVLKDRRSQEPVNDYSNANFYGAETIVINVREGDRNLGDRLEDEVMSALEKTFDNARKRFK